MTQESAISEETEVTETIEDQDTGGDYDIEEPQDDDLEIGEDGTNSLNVPQIDSEETDDDKTPVEEKAETPKEDKQPQAEETKDEKPEVAEKQALPDELVGRAKEAGLSDEDIESFSSDQLEKVLSLVKTETGDQQQTDKPKSDYNSEEFKVELDPDIYDPDICKAINSTAEQINGLKTKLNEVTSALAAQSELSFEKDFESMIATLGDEFSDTLGKGDLEAIGSDSEHFKNRCKVIDEMNAIATGYTQTGKKVPSQKKLFERAVNSVFGDKVKSNVRKEVAAQLEKRSSQIISRPTSKKGKDNMSPERRATNVVKEKLREFGAFDETEINEDF